MVKEEKDQNSFLCLWFEFEILFGTKEAPDTGIPPSFIWSYEAESRVGAQMRNLTPSNTDGVFDVKRKLIVRKSS